MKRLATLVLVSGLLAGCNIPMLTGGGTPVTTTGNQPVEPLGGVTFKPISAVNSRLIGSGNGVVAAGSANMAAPAAAPTAARGGAPLVESSGGMAMDSSAGVTKGAPAPDAGVSTAGGAYSGNVWNNYGYGYYFGGYYGGYSGSDEPMALVSVTEAETAGSKGSFQDIVKTVAAPVIKAWAKDARLVQSNASLGNDGQVFNDPNAPTLNKGNVNVYGGGYYGEAPGWRLNYLSPSRHEALNFFVTAQKTLIIRMRWAPLSLAPENVSVDTSTAIKKLIGAIEDKGFRGEEEKSGLDYFLGTAFEQPKTPGGDDQYHKAEVVYDVPDRARWNATLQQVMGRLVWELSYYNQVEYPATTAGSTGSAGTAVAVDSVVATKVVSNLKFGLLQVSAARPAIAPPYPQDGQPQPSGEWRESYFQNSAQGMVDAQSGAVIRFTRPMKHFYRDYSYQKPPVILPSATPSASVTTAPEKSPEPTPTPGANGEIK
ncbi:hypothetical protein D3C72_772450 [compost metagenome]